MVSTFLGSNKGKVSFSYTVAVCTVRKCSISRESIGYPNVALANKELLVTEGLEVLQYYVLK